MPWRVMEFIALRIGPLALKSISAILMGVMFSVPKAQLSRSHLAEFVFLRLMIWLNLDFIGINSVDKLICC